MEGKQKIELTLEQFKKIYPDEKYQWEHKVETSQKTKEVLREWRKKNNYDPSNFDIKIYVN